MVHTHLSLLAGQIWCTVAISNHGIMLVDMIDFRAWKSPPCRHCEIGSWYTYEKTMWNHFWEYPDPFSCYSWVLVGWATEQEGLVSWDCICNCLSCCRSLCSTNVSYAFWPFCSILLIITHDILGVQGEQWVTHVLKEGISHLLHSFSK